ncbi:MAG: class I adenylate-forming enzyme family protein [Kofleriaceae bacterium]
MSGPLSPSPLLDAVARFRGTFFDLDGGVEVAGEELARLRGELAASLVRRGVERGDRVVLAIGNGPRFVLGLAAALECGASPVLVHSESPPAELANVGERWGARWALVDRGAAGAPADHALAPWASLWQVELPTPRPMLDAYPPLPGVPLHPTSGTTGVPKMAVRPARAALAEAEHYVDAMGVRASDRLLCVAPMSHAYAFGTCAMIPLVSGCSVASMRTFNPKLVDRALEEHAITIFFGVPAMLDLLARRRTPLARHPDLRVYSAGAPLTPEITERFAQAYGVTPRPLYGTTETGGIALAGGPVGGAEVGPPMRGVEVGLHAQDGVSSEPGGLGRLWVRSSSMMAGYLTREGVDATVLVDGAFDTGDLASLHPETGGITLHGRQSDVINVFGLKVLPGEVEAVLRAHPRIAEVIVYAGKHRSGSQIVQAAVVARGEGLDVGELRAHCEAHLAPYKRPQHFHVLERLPRTAAGKVSRAELP